MISTILVPTDGSQTANKAGAYAVGLAKQLQASIRIISVMDKRLLVTAPCRWGARPRVSRSP